MQPLISANPVGRCLPPWRQGTANGEATNCHHRGSRSKVVDECIFFAGDECISCGMFVGYAFLNGFIQAVIGNRGRSECVSKMLFNVGKGNKFSQKYLFIAIF